MRPLRPFCGTVLNAQSLTLPATISTSANGVVTTQLSFLPPASRSTTDVCGSSDSRPATAQPPEPPPTTTKSNASVTCCFPRDCFCSPPPCGEVAAVSPLRQKPQHLLQPRDLAAIGRVEIGEPVERRTVKHRLELAEIPETHSP